MIRRTGQTYLFPVCAAVCLATAGGSWILFGQVDGSQRVSESRDAHQSLPGEGSAASAPGAFGVTIRQPSGPPRVELDVVDFAGNAATASCSSCHATRAPDPTNRRAADLDEFHQGLTFGHGDVACLACHNRRDYDLLQLADGSDVSYANVMALCGQCHGTQMRDYEHGAHGGMTGYWDLTRGPRMRNNCVDCHDPHAPAFPAMRPTFKPRDRFLNAPSIHE